MAELVDREMVDRAVEYGQQAYRALTAAARLLDEVGDSTNAGAVLHHRDRIDRTLRAVALRVEAADLLGKARKGELP